MKGGKLSRRRKRGDKDTRIYVRKRMRKGRIYFVRHLRLAAHGLHPISLFLPNNFTNGHSTFVCLTFHVFQPSSLRSLSLFGRDVGARDSQLFGGEKNSVRRGWKFFLRSQVCNASHPRRYHRCVVKIGDKSDADGL